MAAFVAQTAGIVRGASLTLNGVQAGSAIVAWAYNFTSDVTGTPGGGGLTFNAIPGAHVVNSAGSGMNAWVANNVPAGNYTISDPGDWFAIAEVRGCDTSANLVDQAANAALPSGGSGVSGNNEHGDVSTSAAPAAGGAALAWCIFEAAGAGAGGIVDNTGGVFTFINAGDSFSAWEKRDNVPAAVQTASFLESNQTTDQFTSIIVVIKSGLIGGVGGPGAGGNALGAVWVT